MLRLPKLKMYQKSHNNVGLFCIYEIILYLCDMERQNHGFEYQEELCERHNLVPDKNYTGTWDAYTQNGVPCVVKTFKKGSELPLSDIFNNESRDQDFYLMYGVWSGKKTNIVDEKVIFIDITKWKQLFEWNHYGELKNWIKNLVSNSYDYDLTWKSEVKLWKEKWGTDRIIQPRFKRDHKSQRRIQSAVAYKQLETFLEYAKK